MAISKKAKKSKRRSWVKPQPSAPAIQQGCPEGLIDEFAASLNAGDLSRALEQARVITQKFPHDAAGWKALGVVLAATGRFNEAIVPMQTAVTLNPADPESHCNLGHVLRESGFLEKAAASCRTALAIAPNYPEAHHNLGNALWDLCRYEQAELSYRRALGLAPHFLESYRALGIMLSGVGRFEEAERSFSEGLRVDRGEMSIWDSRLFAANYNHLLSPAELFCEYEAYGEVVADLTKRCYEHAAQKPIKGRRIRVGYSSSDYRGHACRFFMEPIFRNHDREQFELFAYSNTVDSDQHTERMKGYFDHWVDVVRMTDEEMAQRVYDDQIDILVDMAGHTKGNRLPVFAMRPAPIQASYWTGFAYTTGLKEIDYFICDENLVPVGSEEYFSEELLRIPAPGYAYAPSREVTPEVSDLPALRNGYVTFGSLTRTVRLNDPLLRTWGEILERVPNSRLRLDQTLFAQEESRELFWERLEGLGIPRERVDLACSTPHWNAYRDIDITLDCWPHNAGTTTLESLWMGVPVLSKIDRASVGRVGAAMLKPLGLDDWLVESEEAFVERAVEAVSDLVSLAVLRGELRSRLEGSALLDELALARNLENAYRQMSGRAQESLACSDNGKSSCQSNQQIDTDASILLDSPSQQQIDCLLEYHQAGRLVEAEALATSLTQEFPMHPFGWKVLGVLFAQTSRLLESLTFLQKFVRLAPDDAEGHHNLGTAYQELGRLEEAEVSYKRAIMLKPDYTEAHLSLGNALTGLGRLKDAESSYKQAIAVRPSFIDAHNNLAYTLLALCKFEEAELSFKRLIDLEPYCAEAHNDLGVTLRKLGRLDEAKASCEQALALKPDHVEGYRNLGAILSGLSKLEEAEVTYMRAIALRPDYAEAHYDLGVTLLELGKLKEAEASYNQALSIRPDFAEAHNNLGVTLKELGRSQDAQASYEQAVSLRPEWSEVHYNLGDLLRAEGRLKEAEARYKQAILLAPGNAAAHNNLGNLLQYIGSWGEAEASYKSALTINPSYAEASNNLAFMLQQQCRFKESQSSARKAIELKPEYFSAYSNLLFGLNYDPEVSPAELFCEYEAYGEVVADLTKRCYEHAAQKPIKGRRIRVGYSSSDYRGHACRFFMEPIFRNHDREQFELFAYSNTVDSDQHTERMKGYFDHWVDVVRMTDEEMAQRVYDDQIDILVDMAGHTKGNRLPVFAMRPAPIQASYWTGFAYTTGLKEIDYFICDENLVPVGSEEYFSEELLRIPAPGYAYAPSREVTPEVSDLPALRNGYVTFGSLTRTVRLNDPLLRTWGEILERVPNSRLRLDQTLFAQEESRELFWERLEGLGIPRERVDLACSTPHWNAYRDIDITLDCWPHNAGTTTLESLWMGVPVLSKIDRASVGRVGAAMLKPLGLDDWLVESEEAFVERAVEAVSDLVSLAVLRGELRSRLEGSALLDELALARNLENAYRQMSGRAQESLACSDNGKSSCQSNQQIDTDASILLDSPSQQQIDCLLEYHQAGRLVEAEALATSLTQEFPMHPFGWKALGAILKESGKLRESLVAMQWVVRLDRDDAEAHSNLGVVLNELGRLREAEDSHKQAIRLQPDYAEFYFNLGVTLQDKGSVFEAAESYKKAIQLNPDYTDAHYNLGTALTQLCNLNGATEAYRKAVTLKADHFDAHYNLGNLLDKQRLSHEARLSYRRAISLRPFHAGAHNNLGRNLQWAGVFDEAEACYKQAIAIAPDYAEAHNNLGNALQDMCRFKESQSSARKAIELKPEYFSAYSNLLFGLNYDPEVSPAELFCEYEAYGEVVADLTKRCYEHAAQKPIKGRRIRVGYSSSDYRGHACRFFMEPIFRNHDREQFELFAYSNTVDSDQHTERMKGYFDHWVDVVRMTDEEMAQRVYDDQIDILVDMAGHTKGNRLPVFAMRPAPIQASYWTGFAYTTGLKEIDYFICDENLVPVGSEEYFSEELLRIPAPGYAYAPSREVTPEVSDLPALRNGYVTFGSLTRTVRLNDPLLRTWGEILERVPNSRLRLDQTLFAQEESRELFWERLEGLGIPRERVDLACSTPHWNAYRDIDITLDCWPHNAGTTTLESLWMGVPVLSKIDRASVGRVGAAMLKPLGLDDWLVESEEAFVERAVTFASNLDALSKLRTELRGRFEQGPHMDASAMTKHLENAYRQLNRGGVGGFR